MTNREHKRTSGGRVNRVLSISVAALACMVALLISEHASAGPALEHELEGRLLAPCCWVQTLDVHESDLASSLRSEIRTRLARGENATAIEDGLARRYGERIRAVPRGRDPLRSIPLAVGLAMAIALAALVVVGLRWMRRRPERADDPSEAIDPVFDAALDAELRREDAV